jgi:hypothetical protein
LTDRVEEVLGYKACSFTKKDIVMPGRKKWGNGNGKAKAA